MKIGPFKILSIHDSGDEFIDRMTFVFSESRIDHNGDELHECLGTSLSGEGFSQFSECTRGEHLGEEVEWEDLSEELKAHVKNRLE